MSLRTQRRRSVGKVLHNSSLWVSGTLFTDHGGALGGHATGRGNSVENRTRYGRPDTKLLWHLGKNLTGYTDRAVRLDGAADYVEAGRTFTSTFQDDFSILLWHKADDGHPSATVGFWGVKEGDAYIWAYLYSAGNGPGSIVVVYNDGTTTVTAETSGAVLYNGQETWHSLVVTVSATNIKIFHDGDEQTLDGTRDGDMTVVTRSNYANASEWFGIGCRNIGGSAGLLWDGELSSFVILDRIATQTEIYHFHNTPTIRLSNMTVCYPLSEYIESPSADDPVVDVSGNDFHGTLPSGGTLFSHVVTNEPTGGRGRSQLAFLDYYKYTHTSNTDIYVSEVALSSAPAGYTLSSSHLRDSYKVLNFLGLGFLICHNKITSLSRYDQEGAFCIWMYLDSAHTEKQYAITYSNLATNDQDTISLSHSDDDIYCDVIGGGVKKVEAVFSSITSNKWHFVGFSMAAEGSTFVLNGVETSPTFLDGTSSTNSYWLGDTAPELSISFCTIGANANNNTYANIVKSPVGDVFCFRRSLSVTSMANIWRQTRRFYNNIAA